jgi:Trk-type K+ transport system membrane component
VFLRLIFWTIHRLIPDTPYWCVRKDTLKFILDHPRRVYTNMFPSAQTWWLLLTLIVLNGTDWIFFELLNINNDAITSIPKGSRVLDGLFQALAVRSGGFYIVPISSLRIGLQVLYVLMMYISVYPVVITMRNSNVYEERSLGIYANDSAENGSSDLETGVINRFKRRVGLQPTTESSAYFIRQQMRGQLAHDLSWLAVAIFLIVCIESVNFDRDPVTYSVFNVVFEVVSGYGCVGISTGLPNEAYSFSGGWHVTSKLILCAVMLRGRHRGLPVAIDRAVLLPGDSLTAKEEEDHKLGKTMT